MSEKKRIRECSEVIDNFRSLVYATKRLGLEIIEEHDQDEEDSDSTPNEQVYLKLWKENVQAASKLEVPIGNLWRDRQIKTILMLMQNRKNVLYVKDLHELLHFSPGAIPYIDPTKIIDLSFLRAWIGYPKVSLAGLREKYGQNLVSIGRKMYKKCTRTGRRFFREVYIPTICEYTKWESTEMVYIYNGQDQRPKPCHFYYHFGDAATSRLAVASHYCSCKSNQSINLHSIPKSKRAELIRAKRGNVLFMIDYKSAEVRMLAALSKDPKLVRCFEADADVYDIMGRACGIDNRDVIKNIFLSFIYGSSIQTLTRRTGLGVHVIEKIKKKIAKFFPDAIDYIEYVTNFASQKRHFISPTGRIFRLDDESEPHKIFNYVVQSTTADLNNAICAKMLKSAEHSKMILHLHDGYLFECESAWVEEEIEHFCKIAVENPLAGFDLENLHLAVSVSGPSKVWDF